MLIKADISHFKSIADSHLNFGQINVLVGVNGSGKSNILDALYFIRDCAVQDLETAINIRHGIDSVRQWSRTKPYNIRINLQFKNQIGGGLYSVTIGSSRSGDFSVVEESGSWNGEFRTKVGTDAHSFTSKFLRNSEVEVEFSTNEPTFKQFYKGPQKHTLDRSSLFLTYINSPYAHLEKIVFRELINEITNFVLYSIYPSNIRRPQPVSKEETLSGDGSNLASILRKVNAGNKTNKQNIIETLRIVLPIAKDFIVKSAGGYYVPVIRVEGPNGASHDLNLSQVSDGTLRMIGILSAFYQKNAPDKIAMEEPEQMIHPGLLSLISESVKEHIENDKTERKQVFLTTHSPEFVDLFNPEDIIWAEFRDNITVSGKISPRQISIIKNRLFSAGELLVIEGFAN